MIPGRSLNSSPLKGNLLSNLINSSRDSSCGDSSSISSGPHLYCDCSVHFFPYIIFYTQILIHISRLCSWQLRKYIFHFSSPNNFDLFWKLLRITSSKVNFGKQSGHIHQNLNVIVILYLNLFFNWDYATFYFGFGLRSVQGNKSIWLPNCSRPNQPNNQTYPVL